MAQFFLCQITKALQNVEQILQDETEDIWTF